MDVKVLLFVKIKVVDRIVEMSPPFAPPVLLKPLLAADSILVRVVVLFPLS